MQTIELPVGNAVAVGTLGVQVTVAVDGSPLMAQVAAVAALGPLFVQVKVPLTVLPATAVAGKFTVAAISASDVTFAA